MRSRRLIKKLSKSLAEFYKDAWLYPDDEELVYNDVYCSNLNAKGIMHVGGGADYWGEGEEAYTVLDMAEKNFGGWASFCGCRICQHSFDLETMQKKCGTVARRQAIRPTFKALRMVLAQERRNCKRVNL